MNKQFSIDSFLDWAGLHWDFSSTITTPPVSVLFCLHSDAKAPNTLKIIRGRLGQMVAPSGCGSESWGDRIVAPPATFDSGSSKINQNSQPELKCAFDDLVLQGF